MPRSLSEYNRREWLRIRPLVDRYKQGRYLLLNSILLLRRPKPAEATAAVEGMNGADVLVVIAYNQPDLIAMQARLLRAFVPKAIYLIADNSTYADASMAIRSIAHANGAKYVRVPATPWEGTSGGRAHGHAMTWVWRHLLRRGRPRHFGFIDHDLFPVRGTDPFAPLAAYPVCGRVWYRPPRWHLWAGFCFFRFADVRSLPLNFALDWYAGLDTGGCNWWPLYRRLDVARIVDPGMTLEAILPGVPASECAIEHIGDWLHISRWGYRPEHHDQKHRIVLGRLTDVSKAQISAQPSLLAIGRVPSPPPSDV